MEQSIMVNTRSNPALDGTGQQTRRLRLLSDGESGKVVFIPDEGVIVKLGRYSDLLQAEKTRVTIEGAAGLWYESIARSTSKVQLSVRACVRHFRTPTSCAWYPPSHEFWIKYEDEIRELLGPSADGTWGEAVALRWDKYRKYAMGNGTNIIVGVATRPIQGLTGGVKRALVRRYFPDAAVEAALASSDDDICLIRPYYGVEHGYNVLPDHKKPTSLRDLPLNLPELDEHIPLDYNARYIREMGRALAIAHWIAGRTTAGCKFVLGMAHGQGALYLMGFDECEPFSFTEEGVRGKLLSSVLGMEPFIPRPSVDEELWEQFREGYLYIAETFLHESRQPSVYVEWKALCGIQSLSYNTPMLPRLFMDILERYMRIQDSGVNTEDEE